MGPMGRANESGLIELDNEQAYALVSPGSFIGDVSAQSLGSTVRRVLGF